MARRVHLLVGSASAAVLGLSVAWAATPPAPGTSTTPAAKAAPKASAKGAAPAARSGPDGKTIDARPWPRQYAADGITFAVYRPQIDAWTGNKLEARAVMAVKTGETKDASGKPVIQQEYGVVWLTARTETNKPAREVTLDNLVVEKINFPTAKDKEATFLAAVRKAAPTTQLVVSLNQIESSLAIAQGGKTGGASRAVDNDPPEIIFAFQPAVLVLIDGQPVLKPTSAAGVERVINTRAPMFRYQGAFYIGHAGKWVTAAAIEGPWSPTSKAPPPVVQAASKTAAAPAAGPGGKPAPEPSEAIATAVKPTAAQKAAAITPKVITRTHRAELIDVDGDPVFADLPGTSLKYISNTRADVLIDSGGAWYLLIAGRWFTAGSSKGPWAYIDPKTLPADFAKIPSDGPKGAVLASIPDTPEAKESLVANAVPQTATVNRFQAKFTAKYDGAPQFKPIETTNLAFAANSATPIIKVGPGPYYALDNGVWFTAAEPVGPWAAATSVPDDIYKIPSWSPLHYVTYAYVYGVNGDEIFVGYTPGYYGTVVNDGVVVYGTGYPCASWVGNDWYGCPTPYGYGAAFGYGDAMGWSLSFGWGWDSPWYDPWWGPWGGYYPGYYPGYPGGFYGGGAVAGNVYGRWGNSVVAGTAAAWANPYTGNYGRAGQGGYYNTRTGGQGYGYAGRNTNVYTGRSTAAAGGVRYNPETGRVVAGQGGSVSNVYTGQGVAGGSRTAVNTNTGRVTQSAGVAGKGAQGAGAAGGFKTTGANGGTAAGAGYVHYDKATGDVSRGGVAEINGAVYAGKDGNVYKKGADGNWSKAGAGGSFSNVDRPEPSLNAESASRDRGYQRDRSTNFAMEAPVTSRPSFDRGSYGGGYGGNMGGYRGGGGMRGGGGRRR